jgi:hypothetical protein
MPLAVYGAGLFVAQVLEQGNIYFVYGPRVEATSASGLEDIQRLFIILKPHGYEGHRLIVIGRKKLPEIEDRHERNWGLVQKVARDADEIFNELHMERRDHPLKPLFEAKWH